MDVDERGRSEHEASAEASALKVLALAERGEKGAEGDEKVPDEPEPDADEAEADDAEADLGGDEPELDMGINAFVRRRGLLRVSRDLLPLACEWEFCSFSGLESSANHIAELLCSTTTCII